MRKLITRCSIAEGLEKYHDKISPDRNRCGPVAGWDFARVGKKPRGGRRAQQAFSSQHQRDDVAAPDRGGPLLMSDSYYGYSDPYRGLFDFNALPPYSPGNAYRHVTPVGR